MKSFRVWRSDTISLIARLSGRQVPAGIRDVVAQGDFRQLILAGMSHGSGLLPRRCGQVEADCKAAVNLDGEEYDITEANANVRFPVLLLTSDWLQYPWSGFSRATRRSISTTTSMKSFQTRGGVRT